MLGEEEQEAAEEAVAGGRQRGVGPQLAGGDAAREGLHQAVHDDRGGGGDVAAQDRVDLGLGEHEADERGLLAGDAGEAGGERLQQRARAAIAGLLHDNVRLPLELGRHREPDPEAAVARVLALVGLQEFAGAHPAELSGGMRMRASLARALVTRPELLLLDEPFGALDELTRERLDQELLGLWQRDGFAAIAVTHSLAEAVLLADRVLVLRPRPGRVAHTLTIDLPRPRPPELQTTPAFTAVLADLRARLQESA